MIKVRTLLLTGLIAGTLDILCAIFILGGGNAGGVFRFIAQGAFGTAAYDGGPEMILWGAVFHYFIAYAFTLLYFLVYPFLGALKKRPVISGFLYGIAIWCIMNFVVLPLSRNPPGTVSLQDAYMNILILMLAVGLPIAFMARKNL